MSLVCAHRFPSSCLPSPAKFQLGLEPTTEWEDMYEPHRFLVSSTYAFMTTSEPPASPFA
ncbi:hypothetical protein FA13DRAFT_1729975 [Coprinellus micaceus]|uniref:Uncharacterized protein n=1 Tax=Coprinellus micaceus TaxID=71717 RepID=A0A4Y7TI69_COPMI|nr:hypothetical protein FA13DRAFT_1729975 [Coprinellus micaceus]